MNRKPLISYVAWIWVATTLTSHGQTIDPLRQRSLTNTIATQGPTVAQNAELPTINNFEKFALSYQVPVPGMSAKKKAWGGRRYSALGGEYLFQKQHVVLAFIAHDQGCYVWNPLTGLGRHLTEAQCKTFWRVGLHFEYRSPSSDAYRLGNEGTITNLSLGLPGCAAEPSTKYRYTNDRRSLTRDYYFIVKDDFAKLKKYPTCDENTPEAFEEARVAFYSSSGTFVPMLDGTTLFLPVLVIEKSGPQSCAIMLNDKMKQASFVPGCPVISDATLLDKAYSSSAARFRTFRSLVTRPVYDNVTSKMNNAGID